VSPRRWWTGRSLRARLTLVATGCLTAGLILGAVALAAGFASSRLADLDRSAAQPADVVAGLLSGGQLPRPLPVPQGSSAMVQVLEPGGRVVAASQSVSQTLPLIPVERLGSWPRHRAGTVQDAALGDVPLRAVVRDASDPAAGGKRVLIVAAVPLRDVRGALQALRTVLVLVVPAVAALVAVTCWLLVGSALRPVTALRRGADEIGAGDAPGAPQPPPDTTGPSRAPGRLPEPTADDELAALARTLNQMLARLDAAAQRERGFLADAAHELRSPIATLRTSLEVALAHPAGVDWPDTATGLHLDVLRLGRLVDDLLALARLDSGTTRPAQLVNLADIACQTVTASGAGGSRPGTTPHVVLQAEPVLVNVPPEALRRAVANLVDNARRAARQTVRISTYRQGDDAVLYVDDDGPGIPASDRERIFERFGRLDDSRSRDDGGTGLGLAIVRATARSAGGDVSVTDSPLGGARFALQLPAAAEILTERG